MPKSLSIVHFALDEKFIDSAYESFEHAAPGRNKFYVIGSPKDLKYVRHTPLHFISPYSLLNPRFYSSLRRASFVVLHQLTRFHRLLLRLSPADVRYIWIGFGVDYYNLICSPEELLLEKTHEYVKANDMNTRANGMASRAKAIAKHALDNFESMPNLLSKLTAFAPVLEVEYELIRERNGPHLAPYISWNYGSMSHLVDSSTPKQPLADGDILLGNSASITNNHMEALDILSGVGIGNRRIICPLSYGDSTYGDHVVEYGQRLFGDQFVPVTGFLPLGDYLELISRCSVFVANHLRQQGLGNVVSMMAMGARVFLNSRSPIYGDYKEKGAHIYNLDQLLDDPTLLDSPLAHEQVADNQRLLRILMGSATIRAKTENLINQMVSGAKEGLERKLA